MTSPGALQLLDFVVGAGVEGLPTDLPPEDPIAGNCYIVGQAPTGDWAGHAQHLAFFGDGGWRFVAPVPGISAVVKTSGVAATYRGSVWEIGEIRATKLLVDGVQVIGAQQPAIAGATGGTTIDAQARSSLAAVLTALRQHGLIAV